MFLTNTFRYGGYNPKVVDRFAEMGIPPARVVSVLSSLGLDRQSGRYYEFTEAENEAVIAQLFGAE